MSWKKDGGLKAILDARGEIALEVRVPDSNILFDIDTPEDYKVFLERLQRYDVPTDEECEVILTDICRTESHIRLHCRKVAEVSVTIGQALNMVGKNVDFDAIRAAAILYDIAKGKPKHDFAGGRILREIGFGKVGDIVAVHTDLQEGDNGASLEAKIVYLADKFVEDEKLVSIEERFRSSRHHFRLTPEIEARILQRKKRALSVKQEFENLLGHSLEEVLNLKESSV
jgi:HD superfamily phosphodiesterase